MLHKLAELVCESNSVSPVNMKSNITLASAGRLLNLCAYASLET